MSVKKKKRVSSKKIVIVKEPVFKDFDLSSFSDTSQVSVPKSLIGQVIGQDKSVEIIRKAAAQKRNVLLIGIPGTGKSLIAQAMSEILPVGTLQDVLIYPNAEDSNNPRVRVVKAGDGKRFLMNLGLKQCDKSDSSRLISLILPIGWMVLSTVLWQLGWYPDVVYAALVIVGGFLLIGVLGGQMRSKDSNSNQSYLLIIWVKKLLHFLKRLVQEQGITWGCKA